MLNIGIDARLIDGKGGGTKVYTTLLVKHLLEIDRENFYFLYTYKYHPNLNEIVKNKENFKIKIIENKILWRTPLLYSFMIKDPINIIHFPAYNVAPRMIKFKRPKVVVTFHGLDAIFFKKRERPLFWKLNYKISALSSDRIISVSNKLKKELIEIYNIKENKVSTIYYGIPKPNIDFSKIISIKGKFDINEDNFILCVDGNEKRKNIITFIKSISILKEKYNKKIKVIITRSKYYSDIIKKLDLEKEIMLYDWIPHDELNYLYYLSKIIVYPSLYEGVGFPVIEAIQHGKPVLISANTAMTEIIDEPDLIINEPMNEKVWATKIIELLEDEKIYSKLKSRIEEKARKFSVENMVKAHIQIYKELSEQRT